MSNIKVENQHSDQSTVLAEIEDYLDELNENELNSICGGKKDEEEESEDIPIFTSQELADAYYSSRELNVTVTI